MNEQIETTQLKSTKKSQKKLTAILWLVVAALLIANIFVTVLDYNSYRKGQEFGINVLLLAGNTSVKASDSYDKQRSSAYSYLNDSHPDINVKGIKIDNSAVRESMRAVRSSLYDVMKAGGFERYGSYSIEKWFEYSNLFDFFVRNSAFSILPILFYAVLIAVLIWTIITKTEGKKELEISDGIVNCRTNRKKSKQLLISDILSVDTGKSSMRITGNGFKFRISDLTNAEELKSVIMEMKKNGETVNAPAQTDNTDELKKYKDLLDSGVITQKEFDAKKKQLLGL